MKKSKVTAKAETKQTAKITEVKKSVKAVKQAKTVLSLSEVNNKLRAGEKEVIAFKTGFSKSHVSNVLAGRRKNNEIEKEARKITSCRK